MSTAEGALRDEVRLTLLQALHGQLDADQALSPLELRCLAEAFAALVSTTKPSGRFT